MKHRHRNASLLFCLLTCALCMSSTGCGSSKYPKTVSISGKVTWQGKPLAGGSIAFIPVNAGENGTNRPAGGQIGPDGVYQLSSFRSGDGVMPGEYGVTVESYTSWPTHNEPDTPYVWRIPQRYGKQAESGLRFTVPDNADRHLVFDIDLTP